MRYQVIGAYVSLLLTSAVPGYGFSLPAILPSRPVAVDPLPALPWSEEQLYRQAQQVTVRILATSGIGSGILLRRQSALYTVLTNRHVIQSASGPYRIQTVDGQLHSATILKTPGLQQYDLVLLQFQAPGKSYATATIERTLSIQIGDPLFAAGFPGNFNSPVPHPLVIRAGRANFWLKQPLQDGYQLGYTSTIEKGMSGGPVFDQWGKLVGVNGKSDPLWESPELYQDGTQPCRPIYEVVARSSWAIPIDKLPTSLLEAIATPSPLVSLPRTTVDAYIPYEVRKMQIAAEVAHQCRDFRE